MISVAIIGYGNVGQHLHKAFLKTESIVVNQIYVRTLSKVAHLSSNMVTNNLATLKQADIYIIAVSDDAIPEVSAQIHSKNALVVHTSGSVSIDVLDKHKNKGVFYLLQSFSKNKAIDFNQIPFCLESNNEKNDALLLKLATAIGKNTYAINSNQRQQLHVAAVFVNNFTNHMYKIGNDICETHNIPFDILLPLIKETAAKVNVLKPTEAQTGPAKRNDIKTINNHLSLLNDQQQYIYKILTKSIQDG